MINLDDVQRGYDAWAAKPHNAKWVRKIDGTPISNDIVVTIFNTLRDLEDTHAAEPVAWRRKWNFRGLPCPDEFTDMPELAEIWRGHPQTDEVVPLYAAPAHVAAEAQLAALEEASNALRPLSDAVYNDNGDMTVSVPIVSAEECIIAYLADQHIRSALASETENKK